MNKRAKNNKTEATPHNRGNKPARKAAVAKAKPGSKPADRSAQKASPAAPPPSASTLPAAAPATPPAPIPDVPVPESPQRPSILVWEDDPESEGAAPIVVPVPGDPPSRFQLNLIAEAPSPQQYGPGTWEFRYWTTRSALVRGRDFWDLILPEDVSCWQTGRRLPVILDGSVELNAYYHRAFGLKFCHDTQDGRTTYSGESPDIVCHELGHAILDALQPVPWLAQTTETSAFHEAFGDISALLAGLQLDSLCRHVISRHGGWIERDSRWTRLGEALGKAINQRDPDRGSATCLRNAANSFFYQPPAKLPASGPDSQLTREPHSLARTFVGAFVQALGGMVRLDTSLPTVEHIQQVALKAGNWLVSAIRRAPVQLDYFFQVASALTAEAALAHETEARNLIASAFVRRGILPVEALDESWPSHPKNLSPGGGSSASAASATPLGMAAASASPLGMAAAHAATDSVRDGRRFGLKSGLVHLPTKVAATLWHAMPLFATERFRPMVAPLGIAETGYAMLPVSAPNLGRAEPVEPVLEHEDAFITYLFQRGRVEFTPDTVALAITGPMYARKTHRLAIKEGQLTLERIGFDCGFD